MYKMSSNVRIGNYNLAYFEDIEIVRSVDSIADTATIKVPRLVLNNKTGLEYSFQLQDEAVIHLGYNDDLKIEFVGAVSSVDKDDKTITISCNNVEYLFNTPVTKKQFSNATLEDIINYLLGEANVDVTLNCTYNIVFNKYVVEKDTVYEELKKLKSETLCHIFLDVDMLHVHASYEKVIKNVQYDFTKNVEKSTLVYKSANDRPYLIEVQGNDVNGRPLSVKVGNEKGTKKTVKVLGITDVASLQKRGNEELKSLSYDGYDGSITTWLVPFVAPGYSADIFNDYTVKDAKDGTYYVNAVKIKFNDKGGSREIQIGVKL